MKFQVPKDIRPTTDKVRQAVFNILRTELVSFEGKKFLDLYAGSGAVGILALSNKFDSCIFVEKEKLNCVLIQKNIEKYIKNNNNYQIITGNCESTGKLLKNKKFDVIFADPPYRLEQNSYLNLLKEGHDLLDFSGILILETKLDHKLIDFLENSLEQELICYLKKNYGNSLLTFWQVKLSVTTQEQG